MKTLYSRILAIYPELATANSVFFDGTIELRNEGDERGDFIAVWNHPTLPEPTAAQLDNDAQVAAIEAQQTKLSGKADIEAARDAKLAAGVLVGSKHYHTDSAFQTQITGIITAFNNGILPAGATVPIRTVENTNEPKTLAECLQIAGAVMQYVQSVYAESWAAKDALDAQP